MTSYKEEPLEKVLGNYNLKVLGINSESYKDKKGVWWIKTPGGYKILKKVSNSEETLKFILSAIRHLTDNGIFIPEVNKTSDGRDYVNINGVCFVLSDAVEGRNPSYASSQELKTVVMEMAKFHKASAGFFPPPGTKPKCHLGLWIEDYNEQIEDMNRFYENEKSKNENDAAGKVIVDEFPYFHKRALEAIDGLKGQEYDRWVEKAKKAGCLCHQDFAAGNLLLANSGRLYVLDTDSITVDIPARDIRKLINKIMKKSGKWDMELAKKIFQYYQSENPLSAEEWKVVGLDLLFPHLFIGAMNKYCYRRDREWTDRKYLKRIKEMAVLEKNFKPVWDSFASIIPAV